MTTDLTARLATLYATLAEATKACPCSEAHDRVGKFLGEGVCPTCLHRQAHDESCDRDCDNEGRVAMFPGFRQVCKKCLGHGFIISIPGGRDDCTRCSGLAWQVRAGGIEDAEAGLTRVEATKVLQNRMDWIGEGAMYDPMPDRDEILAEALELICKVAELRCAS